MGVHDPTPELFILQRRIDGGDLPEGAVQWFDNAYEIVNGINAKIAAMRAAGVTAPTPRQEQALANLHRGACRWLGYQPSEEECRAEMLTRAREESPHTAYPTKPDPTRPRAVRKVKHYPKF